MRLAFSDLASSLSRLNCISSALQMPEMSTGSLGLRACFPLAFDYIFFTVNVMLHSMFMAYLYPHSLFIVRKLFVTLCLLFMLVMSVVVVVVVVMEAEVMVVEY